VVPGIIIITDYKGAVFAHYRQSVKASKRQSAKAPKTFGGIIIKTTAKRNKVFFILYSLYPCSPLLSLRPYSLFYLIIATGKS
jgi:hypothetical protein